MRRRPQSALPSVPLGRLLVIALLLTGSVTLIVTFSASGLKDGTGALTASPNQRLQSTVRQHLGHFRGTSERGDTPLPPLAVAPMVATPIDESKLTGEYLLSKATDFEKRAVAEIGGFDLRGIQVRLQHVHAPARSVGATAGNSLLFCRYMLVCAHGCQGPRPAV